MKQLRSKVAQNWIAGLGLVALLAGCGANNQNATNPASNTTGSASAASDIKEVKIGYLANIVMPQPLVGIQGGEFAKLVPGVTFKGLDYPAGPAVLEALRSGVVDIAYTGPYPPMNAYVKQQDIVLLAGSAKGGTALMVSQNAPYKTIGDLKGKAIGINQLGSSVDALVRHALIEAGLKPNTDVRLIEVKPAEQAAALQSGQVAAVAAPAPWPSVVQIKGGGRPLLDWKQILANGDYLSGVAFTTKQFADAHPALIKQFVAAHRAITTRLNKDRAKGDAEVLAAWSKVTHKTLDLAVAKAAFATIEFTDDANLQLFQRDMDIAVQVGVLKHKGDLTGFVYTQ